MRLYIPQQDIKTICKVLEWAQQKVIKETNYSKETMLAKDITATEISRLISTLLMAKP